MRPRVSRRAAVRGAQRELKRALPAFRVADLLCRHGSSRRKTGTRPPSNLRIGMPAGRTRARGTELLSPPTALAAARRPRLEPQHWVNLRPVRRDALPWTLSMKSGPTTVIGIDGFGWRKLEDGSYGTSCRNRSPTRSPSWSSLRRRPTMRLARSARCAAQASGRARKSAN